MRGDQNRASRPWFILVAGWPGSGKSTLAAALATELAALADGRDCGGNEPASGGG